MSDLVKRLAAGKHQVVAARLKSVAELERCIDEGFLVLKFPTTQGGTELGVRLDPARTRTADADFAAASGSVDLVGSLVLDYQRVQVRAQLSLDSLAGSAALEVLENEQQWRASRAKVAQPADAARD